MFHPVFLSILERNVLLKEGLFDYGFSKQKHFTQVKCFLCFLLHISNLGNIRFLKFYNKNRALRFDNNRLSTCR